MNRMKKIIEDSIQAAKSEPLPIEDRFFYIADLDRFHDVVSGNLLTRAGFNGLMSEQFAGLKGTPANYFLENSATKKLSGMIFHPGNPQCVIEQNGAEFFNLWSPNNLKLPDKAGDLDVKPWLDHLRFLYPEPREHEHLLDWFAWVLKNQDIKINHAPLLAGNMRIGKDLLLNPIRLAIGDQFIKEPSAEELKEPYTDFLHHAKLVVIQEIQQFQQHNIENKLKPMLADPPEKLRVRLFGAGFYTTPNLVQMIFMSNFRDAMHISSGDGRYFSLWSSAERQEPGYYCELVNWMKTGGNERVIRWLLDHDLSHFDPKRPAPDTHFKAAMIEAGKSNLAKRFEDMIDTFEYPFNVDIVRAIDIERHFRKVEKWNVTTTQVSRTLSEIVKSSRVVFSPRFSSDTGKMKRKKMTLHAIRNAEFWNDAKNEAWISEYFDGQLYKFGPTEAQKIEMNAWLPRQENAGGREL